MARHCRTCYCSTLGVILSSVDGSFVLCNYEPARLPPSILITPIKSRKSLLHCSGTWQISPDRQQLSTNSPKPWLRNSIVILPSGPSILDRFSVLKTCFRPVKSVKMALLSRSSSLKPKTRLSIGLWILSSSLGIIRSVTASTGDTVRISSSQGAEGVEVFYSVLGYILPKPQWL